LSRFVFRKLRLTDSKCPREFLLSHLSAKLSNSTTYTDQVNTSFGYRWSPADFLLDFIHF
jgi:hypothetical protein